MNKNDWMQYIKSMKNKNFDNTEWQLLQPMLYDLVNDAYQWKASLEKKSAELQERREKDRKEYDDGFAHGYEEGFHDASK